MGRWDGVDAPSSLRASKSRITGNHIWTMIWDDMDDDDDEVEDVQVRTVEKGERVFSGHRHR